VGVQKRISGARGETRIGSLVGVSFDVVGMELRYDRPFAAFVDVVEPDGDGFAGRATFRGHTFGRFVLRCRTDRFATGEPGNGQKGGPGVGPPCA
jgi:hypothetical protein